MKKHPDPLKIDWDNWDNWDKSPKPLQRRACRLSYMPNELGHDRDTLGHFFAGRVTAAHFSAQEWKTRANDYLPRPFRLRFQ